jgi:uncharacterized membrane protein
MKRLTGFLFILSALFFSGSPSFAGVYQQGSCYHRADILSIKAKANLQDETLVDTVFTVRLLDGEHKGDTREINFSGKDTMPSYMKYREGQTVFVAENTITSDKHTESYLSVYDVDNTPYVIGLAFLFLVALTAVARIRGLVSLMGLGLTVILLFFVYVPLTLKGYPPLLSAVGVSLISIMFTVPVITGRTKKTIAGIAGASAGILFSVLLTLVTGALIHVSGIIDDELLTLFYVSGTDINIRNIALSGMIISSLGAVIDVSVSVASAVHEFFIVHPDVDRKEAFASAMQVGKDNLGSMVNTLVMAYVGSSLSLILIISLKFDSGMPFLMIINNHQVLIEILKSFIGCLGMIAAVPVTSWVSVWINSRHTA